MASTESWEVKDSPFCASHVVHQCISIKVAESPPWSTGPAFSAHNDATSITHLNTSPTPLWLDLQSFTSMSRNRRQAATDKDFAAYQDRYVP